MSVIYLGTVRSRSRAKNETFTIVNQKLIYFFFFYKKVSFSYSGCFKDCGGVNPCQRDLNAAYYNSATMTIETCLKFCSNNIALYFYFALQNGYIKFVYYFFILFHYNITI